MRTLFRNPVWWVVLFSLIGLFALLLLRGNENAMEYFLSCVGIGISAAVVECSIRQNQIQKDNIKIQLFDKRYNVYKSLIDAMTILQRDDQDRYVLLKENDMNKQMIQIEEELYKSVYLSECLFDKDVYDKLENINNAFCKVAQSYKNMLVANLSNLSSQDDAQEFLSLFRECLLSSSPTAVQDYNEALSQKQPKTYEALMAFAKEAQAYTDLVYKSGILSDIKKYIRVDMLDS